MIQCQCQRDEFEAMEIPKYTILEQELVIFYVSYLYSTQRFRTRNAGFSYGDEIRSNIDPSIKPCNI